MASKLAEVWQREIDGIAKRYVRDFDSKGLGLYASLDALGHGASLRAVSEALGWKDGEPPEPLVKLATEAELTELVEPALLGKSRR